jgi:glycosyltransferase involved in cell wall biosynthesis
MFSIIIPTFNNVNYLKLCIDSIKKNSSYNHEIILHINEGTDGTLNYAKLNNIKYSYSKINCGICIGFNKSLEIAKNEYIVYAHDDMYFCPNWDSVFIDEINKLENANFYLSGIMINKGHIKYSCGDNLESFNEKKLLKEYMNLDHYDFQGSTWAPTLLSKKICKEVGGLSEEYSPGTGSDPDLNMKLWNKGVRIFKGLSKCKVYHFGSVVTRQKEKKVLSKTETGNKGNKIFLLKWGFTIKFFKKYYLQSDTIYKGPLNRPSMNFLFFLDLLKCKISFIYYFIINLFKKLI